MRRALLSLFFLGALVSSGCYVSHPGGGGGGRTCGSTTCSAGEVCCPTCDGRGACQTADLMCPELFCDGCRASFECAFDEFCALPEGACGGFGECTPQPDACPADCGGVCGCDGLEYCNACEANRLGTTVRNEGSCDPRSCGDFTCSVGEICCPFCFGDTVCAPAAEGCPDLAVICPSSDCFANEDCPPDEFCLLEGVDCGFDGVPGTCVPRPTLCPGDCPGICACDGRMYCNECAARAEGVNTSPGVTCGGEVCGGIRCGPDEYCDLGPSCGAVGEEVCLPRNTVCDEFDPVCGCDGVDYTNRCEAARAGATVASLGPCSPMVLAQSCRQAQLALPGAASGGYPIQPPDGSPPIPVWCDMETDGGGWTLVASSRGDTLDDRAGPYHIDLGRLTPTRSQPYVWDGLRPLFGMRGDVRFTCREAGSSRERVDLSFYDVIWYEEWTRGSDADSCFSENNGSGFDRPPPARRNNLSGELLPLGTNWRAGYLEGEDRCDSPDDFTVDFRDRGMDSNQMDGTDWGEDDGTPKCGAGSPADAVWQIWVRER